MKDNAAVNASAADNEPGPSGTAMSETEKILEASKNRIADLEQQLNNEVNFFCMCNYDSSCLFFRV